VSCLLYLDQNYLSGIAKHKPAFAELEPVLREAVARGVLVVVESAVHERESAPRPDLGLLELLRGLSGGRRLPDDPDAAARDVHRRMADAMEQEFPERRRRAGDEADLEALAIALTRCELVGSDAFMADVIRRTRLNLRHRCEVFSGRRADVLALRDRLRELVMHHGVMVEDNKRLVRRALEEIYTKGDLELANELVHPDFVDHEPAHPDHPPGPESVKQTVRDLHSAFGELRFEVHDEIGEGDKVVQRVTMSGRHAGPLMGRAPTGKKFAVRHMYIWRIADEKIVEHWGSRDDLGLLRQLGLL